MALNLSAQAKLVGRIVRFHRKKSGLSQIELARLAGVGKAVVFDVEHGKTTVQFDTLIKLLSTLNVRLDFQSPLMESFNRENHEA